MYLVCMSDRAVHDQLSFWKRAKIRFACWLLNLSYTETIVSAFASRHYTASQFLGFHGTIFTEAFLMSELSDEDLIHLKKLYDYHALVEHWVQSNQKPDDVATVHYFLKEIL